MRRAFSSPTRVALGLAFVYIVTAALLDAFSDQWLRRSFLHVDGHLLYELPRAAAVTLLTGVLLYLIIRRALTANQLIEAERRKSTLALRQAYDILEERVQDRTEELSRANWTLRSEVAERELIERELTTLLEISHNLGSTLDLKPLLGLILDQLHAMVPYKSAAIYALQENEFAVLDSRGAVPQEQALKLQAVWREAVGYQDSLRQRQPVIEYEPGEGEAPHRFLPVPNDEQRRALLSDESCWLEVPLIVRDRLIGILAMEQGEPDCFTPRHAQLAMAIGNQAAVAIENARLYEDARRLAILEERERLARDLHDSAIQAITAIVWSIRSARETLGPDLNRPSQILDSALSTAKSTLSEMRGLIFDLRPEALQSNGLAEGLARLGREVTARSGIPVQTRLCDEPDLPETTKVALYRIAQEALYNASRHARPTQIELSLRKQDCEVVLEVRDDGEGFDQSASYPGHLGLQSMRERAAHSGGVLVIESAPSHGTCIQVCIPVCRSPGNIRAGG